MKKNISEQALYERMRQLAGVDEKPVNESSNHELGTLIDYKRAADGIAYGIVKENHNYYIKKAGLKQNPSVADFVYIGGLQNIKQYQYKSLAEADKNRNMILHTINEALNTVIDKTNNKKKINEDVVSSEIEKAEKKLGDAEAVATASATKNQPSSNGDEEISLESEPEVDDEEMAADDSIESEPEGDDEEMAADDSIKSEPEGDDEDNDNATKEIERSLGKLTNTIRKTQMTNSQIKSYVNTFLSAFKDKFPNVEIEDRKAMAEKIIKVIPDKEIQKLISNVPQDEKDIKEEQCAECGSFATYAKSRGYNNAESLMECDLEEVANLISGYGTAHADGMNDGDLENVALIIKIISPKILNTLRNDYGHEEYADKLSPIVHELDECDQEEGVAKLNELFGGLKSLGNYAAGGINKGIQKGVQAAKNVYQAGAEKVNQTKQAVGQAAKQVQQIYHAGEVSAEIKKVEKIANDLGKQISALNTRLQKAGKNPVNINSILNTIKNQISKGDVVNIGDKIQGTMSESEQKLRGYIRRRLEENAGIRKPILDENKKSDTLKKLDTMIDKQYRLFESQFNINSILNTNKNQISEDGAVNIGDKIQGTMSESEQKLRGYIRRRLEENAGIRKPILDENKKSDTLKKLDTMIDKQYRLFESQFTKKIKRK